MANESRFDIGAYQGPSVSTQAPQTSYFDLGALQLPAPAAGDATAVVSSAMISLEASAVSVSVASAPLDYRIHANIEFV
ncbi:MAG: hypothetical protein D6732_14135, partial [Methanobacteriota archaeon]